MTEVQYIDIDLAKRLSATLDKEISPEITWAACRSMKRYGYIKSMNADLSTLEIGPYRIVTLNPTANGFVELMLRVIPDVVSAIWAGGSSSEETLSSLLASGVEAIHFLTEHSVIIDDDNHWRILICAKMIFEKQGSFRMQEFIPFMEKLDETSSLAPEQINHAISEIKNLKASSGDPIQLIRIENDYVHVYY